MSFSIIKSRWGKFDNVDKESTISALTQLSPELWICCGIFTVTQSTGEALFHFFFSLALSHSLHLPKQVYVFCSLSSLLPCSGGQLEGGGGAYILVARTAQSPRALSRHKMACVLVDVESLRLEEPSSLARSKHPRTVTVRLPEQRSYCEGVLNSARDEAKTFDPITQMEQKSD